MAKKITFTPEQTNEIISLYINDKLGTPTIGKRFGVHKAVINRILKENGVELDSPGRRHLGGKSAADKRYYQKNKEHLLNYCKKWAFKNREHLRKYHSEWRDDNREKLNERGREYEKNKIDSDPKYKLMKRTQSALYSSLKERNINKAKRTFETLGYTLNDLVTHLENQFTPGMSWDNYGEWHVDHIIPMSKFNFTDIHDYEFKQCWGLPNLRPMWATNKEVNGKLYSGNLNKSNKVPSTCYQFRIRELKKSQESDQINISELSLDNATVKLIDKKRAKLIIEEYEWLGYMPAFTKYHFGLFFNVNGAEKLGGVLTFQNDYVENVGGWDKYGYSGKILLLSRGVCLWWTPKNSATFFISKALRWLELNTEYKVITATVDKLAGEIGTIYQAANWYYAGVMDGNIVNGKERNRLGVIIDGQLLTSRQIRNKLGTMKKSVILEHYPDAKFVKQAAKARYFYFLGSKKERRRHLAAIKNQLKSYPKR